jgi:hypothetical protein
MSGRETRQGRPRQVSEPYRSICSPTTITSLGWLIESKVIEDEVDLVEVYCRPECLLLVSREQREYAIDLGYMLALFGVTAVQEAGDCRLVSIR